MDASDSALPIVVGVEDKQRGALRYAMEEADKFGCGIRVVHAYTPPATGVAVLHGSDLGRASEEEAQAIVDGSRDYVESAGSGANVEYSAQVGAPTRVLESESLRARIMVLGPDDNAWYERILVGEVGSWLVTHAACPVVVVPDTGFHARRAREALSSRLMAPPMHTDR